MFPSTHRAGTTLDFTSSYDDYKGSDGYSLTYHLINGSNRITISGTVDGDDFDVTVPAATTAGWSPGFYIVVGYVALSGTIYNAEEGTTTILADPATSTTYDGRTHAKKMLDAVEAVLEGRITADVEQYSIAGRSLTKIPVPDLIKLRDKYRAEVANELAAERIGKGLQGANRVLVRFT